MSCKVTTALTLCAGGVNDDGGLVPGSLTRMPSPRPLPPAPILLVEGPPLTRPRRHVRVEAARNRQISALLIGLFTPGISRRISLVREVSRARDSAASLRAPQDTDKTVFDFSTYNPYDPYKKKLMLPPPTPSHRGMIIVQPRAPSSGCAHSYTLRSRTRRSPGERSSSSCTTMHAENTPDAISAQPHAPSSGPAPSLRSRTQCSFAQPYPPSRPTDATPVIALESSTGAAPTESTPEAANAPAIAFEPSAGVAPVENAPDALSAMHALAEGGAGAKGHVQTNGWIVSSKGEVFSDRAQAEASVTDLNVKFKFVDSLDAGRDWYNSLKR
ncbi:hypothetical protein B0H19DRAFT_1383789 [Mycena capillaripes]|nr:hypothetical protein B0H19DRAFT_1383706 [Mycena capillaripes]KAJ6533181.1 hypothetical protein B0H19DRAFT_1383789 [Mycena capillaripes]